MSEMRFLMTWTVCFVSATPVTIVPCKMLLERCFVFNQSSNTSSTVITIHSTAKYAGCIKRFSSLWCLGQYGVALTRGNEVCFQCSNVPTIMCWLAFSLHCACRERAPWYMGQRRPCASQTAWKEAVGLSPQHVMRVSLQTRSSLMSDSTPNQKFGEGFGETVFKKCHPGI